MTERDFGCERFKVAPFGLPGSRLAEVAVEDLDAIDMPPQVMGAVYQRTLGELTIDMVTDLFRARLANVNDGFALEMLGRQFDGMQVEIGSHGLSPQMVIPEFAVHRHL